MLCAEVRLQGISASEILAPLDDTFDFEFGADEPQGAIVQPLGGTARDAHAEGEKELGKGGLLAGCDTRGAGNSRHVVGVGDG